MGVIPHVRALPGAVFGRTSMTRCRLAILTSVVATGIAPTALAQSAECSQSLQSLADLAPVGGTVLVPACTYHETLFVNKAVTLDGQNAATIDGDGTRDRWAWINTSNVTIRNFTMRNAAPTIEEGALATAGGISNIVIDHNDLSGTKNGDPIAIGGTSNSKVTNNQIHGGGQLGIETYKNTNLTIQANHVYNNNTAGDDPNFGAGGLKLVSDVVVNVVGNEVDHNSGPGIWVDIKANDVTIANNNVHDQAWNPIFYEISSYADIYGNVISASNTNPDGNWGCIVASSSGDVSVHDNTCLGAMPIQARVDQRNDKPLDAGRNVRLTNNRVGGASTWVGLSAGQNGNVDSGNAVLLNLSASTPVPVPTVDCQVEVKINGVEQGWQACQ